MEKQMRDIEQIIEQKLDSMQYGLAGDDNREEGQFMETTHSC